MAQKTVLVTGASRGIGKAIAIKFAKKGYNVAISCVRSKERLMQAKKEIESYQVSCLAYVGDMGAIMRMPVAERLMAMSSSRLLILAIRVPSVGTIS